MNHQQNSILGDYLFDYKDMDAEFLTTIYEEDGKLYSFSGIKAVIRR